MLKIMFFNRTFFGGGVEKALLDVAKGLNPQKFDITIMVRRIEGELTNQYLQLEKDYPNIHIRQAFDYIKPGENIFSKAKNVILTRLAEKCLRRFPKIYYAIAIKDKFDIEVAYMHNEALAIIASSTNKKSKKIAWVHTDLSKIDSWNQYFTTRKRQAEYFKKCDKVICVSKLVKEQLYKLLGVRDNVDVIYNPINIDKIKSLAKSQSGLKKSKPTICAVGRLSYEKNFELLIKAHAKLVEEGFGNELWIVGDGPEREKLSNIIKELKVESSAKLLGFQSNPYPFIKNADILALTSIYEGMPVVTAEAFALGKPVVSCCNITEELFNDKDCGIYTDYTVEGFAAAIRNILSDKEFYSKCSYNALDRVQIFEKNNVITQIERMFLSV